MNIDRVQLHVDRSKPDEQGMRTVWDVSEVNAGFAHTGTNSSNGQGSCGGAVLGIGWRTFCALGTSEIARISNRRADSASAIENH